jgi:hypothetical protein
VRVIEGFALKKTRNCVQFASLAGDDRAQDMPAAYFSKEILKALGWNDGDKVIVILKLAESD